MISITNGKEFFLLKERETIKIDKNNLKIKQKYSWNIDLVLSSSSPNNYTCINKCLPNEGDILKTYKNIRPNISEVIYLSNDDYQEVKNIFNNMQNHLDHRKESLILSGSILLSSEWYQYVYLEGDAITLEDLFEHYTGMSTIYKNAKSEIINKTKTILKEQYKIKGNII